MATVNLAQSVDMSNPLVWYGSVTVATSSQIQVSDGINLVNYYGSFTYFGGYLSGGTITSATYAYYGSQFYSISGVNASAITALGYLNNGDGVGLLSYVLSGNDVVNGSSYGDTVVGYAGNDGLYGNNGDDILAGGAGDDTIKGGPGNDLIIGGSGSDTALYSFNFSQYVIFPEAAGWLIVYGPEGIDCISQTEVLKFSDATYNGSSFTPVNVSGGVYAVAASKIDMRSLSTWIGQYTYADSTLLIATDGIHSQASFGSFSYNSTGYLSGGTIQSIAYEESGVPTYSVTGTHLDLAVYNNYTSNNDVQGLARLVFVGNDKILGSAMDDFAEGYAGNDTIDGGVGIDTVIYQSTYAASTIVRNSNGTVTISSAVDGTDILTNVEFAQFSDRTVSLSNTAPNMTSGTTATTPENVSTSTAVYTATATDPDANTTLSYSISGGADASLFNINANTGSVTFMTAPNYEAPVDAGANNVYDIVIQASDGALTATKAVAITVANVNEAASITSAASASTQENVLTSTAVYTTTAIDPDANTTLAYSISGGADASLFNINANTGSVTFKTPPNYEAPADADANDVYDITVQASDGSLTATKAVSITVTDVNEIAPNSPPTITSSAADSTPENVSTSTAVYTATATDPDASTTLSYSISGGADAALFNISASTGAVTFKASPNFEAPKDVGANNVYDIVVQASDGSLTATKSVAITVTDVQETTTSNLHGMTYFWKPDSAGNHALLSGVTVNASGGAGPAEGANAPLQVKNIAWDASGHVTADVYAHITSGMDSFDLNLDFGTGTNAAFISAMDSSWTLLNNSSTSSLLISAYSMTATGSGDLKLGSLAFEVGSAGQAHIGVNGGSDVSFNDVATKATAFAYDMAHSTTGADGSFTISSVASGSYGLTASRGITDLGNAITSADALAALKIAVAINPNATVNGQQLAVSPFQFMAADANGDGRVTSADALAILKMAVHLTGSITPQWMFVEDTRDFYDDANGVFTLNRSNASWDHTINANLAGDTTENLVGIIKGDVNGSWVPPTGSSYVETLQPSYFTALANTIHTPISEFGVL